ncbi:MAG: hypothetical protein ACRENI_12200 [Gemmatimonadaceae bacterium]
MATPSIVMGSDFPAKRGHKGALPHPEMVWSLLAATGLAFAVIGGLDIALAWYPFGFGSPEWEFGTVTATLNGLPLPAIGIVLMLAGSAAGGHRMRVRATSVLLAVLTVLLVAAGILYLTVVPVAFGSVENSVVEAGLVKAVVKAAALLVLYPLLFAVLAVKGWRLFTARS